MAEDEFLNETKWDLTWRMDYNLYKGILDEVRKHRLKLMGLNVQRDLVRKVAERGIEGLAPEDRAKLPDMDLSDRAHRAYVRSVYRDHQEGSLDDFVRLIEHALNDGFSVVFDVHISEAEFQDQANYLLGHDEEKGVPTTQDLRDTQFGSWRSADVHVEHVIGLAKDEAGKRFYKAKDSDTPAGRKLSPWYNKEYFSVEFVRSRVLFVMVHKDGPPDDIRSRLAVDDN